MRTTLDHRTVRHPVSVDMLLEIFPMDRPLLYEAIGFLQREGHLFAEDGWVWVNGPNRGLNQ